MTDITSTHLEAAIIDQKVAGAFRGKRYAFVAVHSDFGWALGVAVENEGGYHPIDGKAFNSQDEAAQWADDLNTHIGHTPKAAMNIVGSTLKSAHQLNEYLPPAARSRPCQHRDDGRGRCVDCGSFV